MADLKMFPVKHHLGGRVHRGFYAEYDKVIPGIKEALAKHNKKGTKTIWVTGHSLGGAMAVLVAAELQPNGGLHTFGQPRVGNAEFLKSLDGIKYYRYRNNNDIVTALLRQHQLGNGGPILASTDGRDNNNDWDLSHGHAISAFALAGMTVGGCWLT